MGIHDTYPAASHTEFPYYFDDDEGISFGPYSSPTPSPPVSSIYKYDLAIYYGDMGESDFIDCRCSRWDISNYSVIIGTWLKRSDVNTLLANITPGAVGELYKILGEPHYYDRTWDGSNTLKFLPTPSSTGMVSSKLRKMRSRTIAYPKNVSLHPIKDTDSGWIEVKLECLISGNQSL